jgi:general secretion pathway protein C
MSSAALIPMEVVFRKHFWIFNLLFIALASLLVARTVNLFVESALAPAPTLAPARTAARHVATTTGATLELERLAKVTGLPVPAPVVEPSQDDTKVDPNAPPVKTGLRVRLVGTLEAEDPAWSLATIEDLSAQRTAAYMVGDKLTNTEAVILEIERARVIIMNGGRKEFINSEAGDGAVAYVPPAVPALAAAPPPSRGAPGTNVTGAGIRETGENQYEVPRAEIDKALSNLNDIAMQARIVPAFQDGVAKGFKLFSIRPDSLYQKIGVQNGDIIRRINGYDMNSPEKALEVYSKLKEASRVDIEVERNGSVVRKTYNIR